MTRLPTQCDISCCVVCPGYGAYGDPSLGYPEVGILILTESGLHAVEIKDETDNPEDLKASSDRGGTAEGVAAQEAEQRQKAKEQQALRDKMAPKDRVDAEGWCALT